MENEMRKNFFVYDAKMRLWKTGCFLESRKHPGDFGTQATKLNQHSMDWCVWWLWGSVSNIPDSYLNTFPVQVERRTATAQWEVLGLLEAKCNLVC